MKSKLIALLMVAAFGLMIITVGCESLKTTEQRVAAGCASAAASVRVLTVALDAGKLSQSQQFAISKALDYISPICTADKAPTLGDSDMVLFGQSVMTLQQEAVTQQESIGHE